MVPCFSLSWQSPALPPCGSNSKGRKRGGSNRRRDAVGYRIEHSRDGQGKPSDESASQERGFLDRNCPPLPPSRGVRRPTLNRNCVSLQNLAAETPRSGSGASRAKKCRLDGVMQLVRIDCRPKPG